MELIIYIVFGAVVISLLILWVWVMRTVAKTTALLNDATATIETIVEEVKIVAQEFTEVTDELEQARIYEKTCPKNRRSTDRQDK